PQFSALSVAARYPGVGTSPGSAKELVKYFISTPIIEVATALDCGQFFPAKVVSFGPLQSAIVATQLKLPGLTSCGIHWLPWAKVPATKVWNWEFEMGKKVTCIVVPLGSVPEFV